MAQGTSDRLTILWGLEGRGRPEDHALGSFLQNRGIVVVRKNKGLIPPLPRSGGSQTPGALSPLSVFCTRSGHSGISWPCHESMAPSGIRMSSGCPQEGSQGFAGGFARSVYGGRHGDLVRSGDRQDVRFIGARDGQRPA